MSDRLTIGRFGREAQLTPRQLRYYHALGLLVPAAVDPATGYRYYDEAQLATAELIGILRSVDMPLAEIQGILIDRSAPSVRAAFDRLRTRVEERLARARQILSRIDELEVSAMQPEVKAVYAFEAFTPEAQAALRRAQALAEELRHPVIGIAHLMAAVPDELGTSEAVLARAAGPPGSEAVQPLPGSDVRAAIAGAFRSAGDPAPSSALAVVGTRHLAEGCLSTPEGQSLATELNLHPRA